MKRLFPLPSATVFLSLFFMACGGSGGSPSGGGGSVGPARFCDTDSECSAGSTNECTTASCDISAGVCVSTPVPEGSPCNGNDGVCRDGFCAQTELKAFVKSPSPEPNALFGTAVSILGDRMIVGAPSSGPPFGRVAVFQRTDGEWTVTQQIDTPVFQGGSDGLFAWSLASANDFFVVGSMGFGLGGTGSARVFRRFQGVADWRADTALGYLRGSDSHPLDLFGTSLALTPSGDTLVVGAPGHSNGEPPIPVAERDYSGAAYIFENTRSLWTETAILKASNTGGSYLCEVCGELACPTSGAGDGFGVSVAISGDTVVVGAPAEASAATGVDGDESDDSAPEAGAAYVFERVEIDGEVSWPQTAYLKASNTNPGDHFGFSVAIDGEIIVIGAEREDSGDGANEGDNSAIDAGAVYVFSRTGGTWAQTQYLKASNATGGYFFGANLAMSSTTLVVGSPGESSIGGDDSGAAYVFTRVDGSWAQTNFFKAFNADAGAAFAGPHGSVSYGAPNALVSCEVQATTTGASMSLSGDTLVVGSPYEDSASIGVNGVPTSNAIPNSGAVYIFDNSEGQ